VGGKGNAEASWLLLRLVLIERGEGRSFWPVPESTRARCRGKGDVKYVVEEADGDDADEGEAQRLGMDRRSEGVIGEGYGCLLSLIVLRGMSSALLLPLPPCVANDSSSERDLGLLLLLLLLLLLIWLVLVDVRERGS